MKIRITRAQEKQMDIENKKYFDDLSNRALTNPLLKNFEKLNPYFLSFGAPGRASLVAVLPVAEIGHPRFEQHDYFSCPSKDGGPRLSPVFLIDHSWITHHNPPFQFDSEKLSMSEIEQNPVCLLFHGCDDGHVGKRFKTHQDAMDYLNCMLVFEDIFDDEAIAYHN
jgi:hypothetical protein